MSDDCDCPPAGAPAWMATFGDLMSLLLTFFVLLLSFANMDVMKFQGMVGSMREAFGVKYQDPGMHVGLTSSLTQMFDREAISNETPNENDQLLHKLKKLVERHHLAGQVEVTTGKDGITMRVEGDMIFAPGSVDVSPAAFIFLDEMAAIMNGLPFDVTVEGHTDDRLAGAALANSNWQLSSMRAANTVEYLTTAGGVNPQRMSARGFASAKPLSPNTTAKGRRRNRRVEFVYHKVMRAPAKGRGS